MDSYCTCKASVPLGGTAIVTLQTLHSTQKLNAPRWSEVFSYSGALRGRLLKCHFFSLAFFYVKKNSKSTSQHHFLEAFMIVHMFKKI